MYILMIFMDSFFGVFYRVLLRDIYIKICYVKYKIGYKAILFFSKNMILFEV